MEDLDGTLRTFVTHHARFRDLASAVAALRAVGGLERGDELAAAERLRLKPEVVHGAVTACQLSLGAVQWLLARRQALGRAALARLVAQTEGQPPGTPAWRLWFGANFLLDKVDWSGLSKN